MKYAHSPSPPGNAVVISDLHIGSPYFLREELLRFLDGLPPGLELILNGDTVDYWQSGLNPANVAVLDRLRSESRQRRLSWILGNHDEDFPARIGDPARIEFATSRQLGTRLFLAHGHDFDEVMPSHGWFLRLFRLLHLAHVFLGARECHVAEYAKRWPTLYRILLRDVRSHAVACARQHGCTAVACGHTHFPEQLDSEGIRYFNTGSWTERPLHYLRVQDDSITMLPWP